MTAISSSHISVEHQKLIDDLRKKLSHLFTPELHTDFDLLRWLQGFDFKIEAVVPALKHHLRFRQAFDYKTYICHPVMRDHMPYGFLGSTGKDDLLVFLENTGGIDGDRGSRCVTTTQTLLTAFSRMEKYVLPAVHAREAATGRQSGLLFISDLEGINRTSLSSIMDVYRPYILSVSQYYLAMSRKLVIVNAPPYMYYLSRILRPILQNQEAGAFKILSSDWKKQLLEYVDADRLPVHWGGKLVDENGDPKCPSKILIPKHPIPERFYWKPRPGDPTKDQLEQLVIPARQHKFVSMKVEQENSFLKWFFYANLEHSFGVYYAKDEQDFDTDSMDMVYPHFTLLAACIHVPEHLEFLCKRKGFYRLRFGNEHAWVSRLTVSYHVEVKRPWTDKEKRDWLIDLSIRYFLVRNNARLPKAVLLCIIFCLAKMWRFAFARKGWLCTVL